MANARCLCAATCNGQLKWSDDAKPGICSSFMVFIIYRLVPMIEDRTSRQWTCWHWRQSTGFSLPPPITHMSTEQPHVCQQKEGETNIYCIHKKYSKVTALLWEMCAGLTDCSGERGSPKPIVNEAIWRELGSCQEKQTSCQWLWYVVRWVQKGSVR